MSKAFFDELHITALMAAPSLGRRSWYHFPSDIKKAAALISQSRRWVYGRVKRAAVRRLFSFAVVRQISIYYNSLMVSVIAIPRIRLDGA